MKLKAAGRQKHIHQSSQGGFTSARGSVRGRELQMTQRGLDLVSPRAPVELPANNAITYWNHFLLKSTSLNSFALVCGLPGEEEEEEEGRGFVVVMLVVLSFSMVLALWYLRVLSSCNGNSVLIWSLWTWTQLK